MGRSIGWFDAFRDNGGPTWYGDNRTPVVVDTGTFAIIAVFSIFLLAFLIIMPGIRRQVRTLLFLLLPILFSLPHSFTFLI